MNDSKISVRYAKAFYELAESRKIEDKVYRDVLIILDISTNKDVEEIYSSPVISSGKKLEIIKNIVKENVDQLTVSFLELVFKNKRETYLAQMARHFIKIHKQKHNIKTVEITTAIEVDDNIKEGIKKQVLKSIKAQIELVTKTDEKLVGGFVVQIDDLLYDASVKTQLRKIQQNLVKEKL